MINQYADFMSIADKHEKTENTSFFEDVMLINKVDFDSESRRGSICSNVSQKLEKKDRMVKERELLIALENFNKNRMERKWGNNKKELERYIRLFEPVVIQALKVGNF